VAEDMNQPNGQNGGLCLLSQGSQLYLVIIADVEVFTFPIPLDMAEKIGHELIDAANKLAVKMIRSEHTAE
jgi:hypothetical protein